MLEEIIVNKQNSRINYCHVDGKVHSSNEENDTYDRKKSQYK